MKPRLRPQRKQRRTMRDEYFGRFLLRAMTDSFANTIFFFFLLCHRRVLLHWHTERREFLHGLYRDCALWAPRSHRSRMIPATSPARSPEIQMVADAHIKGAALVDRECSKPPKSRTRGNTNCNQTLKKINRFSRGEA